MLAHSKILSLLLLSLAWALGCSPKLEDKDVVGNYHREETTTPTVTGASNVGPPTIVINADHTFTITFVSTNVMMKGKWAVVGTQITFDSIQIGIPTSQSSSLDMPSNPSTPLAALVDQFPNGQQAVESIRQGHSDFKPIVMTSEPDATKLTAPEGTAWIRTR
jgi:poly(3-hydroxyalkanoate) synthetase